MHVTFHDDVFLGLDFSFATWAAGGEVREESLSVFTDGSMSSSHTSEVSTQWIGEPYKGEPWATVTLDSHLGNKSDIFHHNHENNQLERWVWPPRDVS